MEKSFCDQIFNLDDFSDFSITKIISSGQIIRIISRMLMKINPELGLNSWQTSYIAVSIALNQNIDDRLNIKTLLLLSLFHNFGMYHFIGENQVHRDAFTSDEINRNYLYCYYYLKEMTPLDEDARTVLFYDKKYDEKIAAKVPQMEYASIVFLAEKLSKMIMATKGEYTEQDFFNYSLNQFNPVYLETFKKIDKNKKLSKKLLDNTYEDDFFSWLSAVNLSNDEANRMLKLLIYIMDFKSTQTVQHTIHCASYSAVIAKMAGCSKDEIEELFVSGIFHDLGKMAIRNSILESPTKLSSWEFKIMCQHVKETKMIIEGLVPENIYYIALRHHEKLDGSGYPYGLKSDELTIQQRILTVADIFSALVDERSYKDRYPREKIYEIIKELSDSGKIDSNYSHIILENYDLIQNGCMMVTSLLTVPLGLVEIQFQEELNNIQTF